jgi:hypothetical protein
MKPFHAIRFALSAAGLCAAALLVEPRLARAFTVVGPGLDMSQRDVRVFDNFTDPEANDNTTPHPNWPGATGVELAVWKAVSEWGSERHGDGSGDPSQPGGVGSGGANFDATWQGNAPGVGTINDNVVSEMAGCAGGVIIFTEVGASGWRMRLCDTVTWGDGPGDPGAGVMDIQGLVCREYGHLLGLGNSLVAGSTMYVSLSGNGVAARSIEADDRAGVQFIYGAISPTKPHVDAVLGSSSLTIVGRNFPASGNDVWFTQAGGNPTGDPVMATGLTSTAGGTVITLPAPAGAGPGDVLVRKVGVGGDSLSNAYPWSPSACPAPADFCTPKVNSQGCLPAIGFVGNPSASGATPFLITATQVLNNKTGFLIYGYTPANTPFQGGTLCFSGTLKRTPAQNSGGNPPPNDCSGSYSFDFNARIASGIDPNLVVGRDIYAQYYSRDPASSFAVGLTNALAFTICP